MWLQTKSVVEAALLTVLKGSNMHSEGFVRKAQTQQKTLCTRQPGKPRRFCGRLQQVAQVYNKYRRNNGKRARARAPHSGKDKLPEPENMSTDMATASDGGILFFTARTPNAKPTGR